VSQNPNVNKSQEREQSAGSLRNMATGAGGMAASVAAGIISSKVTDSSDTTESTLGTVATMAPTIGAMFGPWGLAIGAAVSGIGLLINAGNKTDEELLKEAQEVSEGLDEMKNELKQSIEDLDSLESNEHKFAELIKGVN
jgi:hypothetical protein